MTKYLFAKNDSRMHVMHGLRLRRVLAVCLHTAELAIGYFLLQAPPIGAK